jgi:chitodextrinase
MRRPILLLLAVLALALWGCNEDTPLQSDGVELAEFVSPAPAGGPDVVTDLEALLDKTDPLDGIHNTLVILANFDDTPAGDLFTETSRQTVQNFMFPDAANDYSVDELFREMSYGVAGITGQTVGPYPIPSGMLDYGYAYWGDLADAAADSAGIDLTQYEVFVYVYPPGTNYDVNLGYGGIAYSPHKNAIFKWQGISNYGHELGHLFGMGHSGRPDMGVYADLSCIMGTSWGPGWIPLRQANAVWKYEMGWFDPAEVLTLDAPGNYTVYLAPSEREASLITDPPSGNAVQFVVLDPPNGAEPTVPHYLSFRRSEGDFDTLGWMDQFTGLVHVHTKPGHTERMDMLGLNQSYATDLFEVTVTSDPTSPAEWVQLQIEIYEPAPAVAVLPETVWTSTPAAGTTAEIFDLWILNTDPAGSPPVTLTIDGDTDPNITLVPETNPITLEYGVGVQLGLALNFAAVPADGLYELGINVYEAGASRGVGTDTAWYGVDTTAPTVPVGVVAEAYADHVFLAWDAATDALSGVRRYEVRRDGVSLGFTTGLTFTDDGVSAGNQYAYDVRVDDQLGNASAWSDALIVSTSCDNCYTASVTPTYVYSKTQPKYFASGWTLSIDHTDGASCAPNEYTVIGHCHDPDLDYAAPNSLIVAPGETSTAQALLQPLVTTLMEGIYSFTMQVSETVDCTEVANFTCYYVLDATAPTAPTGCAAQMTLNDSAVVSWNASTDATAGVDHYEIRCNDALVGTSTTLSFEHEGVYFDYRYTYEVRAIDKAGNVSGWSNSVTIGCRKCPTPQES